MSELLAYAQLGVRHILDVDALDHVLFLVALAAIYRLRDVRSALWVVTAFTLGHSLTLALAVTGAVALPTALIEFMIPLTIVITGVENMLGKGRYRPLLAGVFGLVHGAGFANYLRALFVEQVTVPLFGFNLGIEIGQLAVLAGAALALAGLDRLISATRLASDRWPPLRVRVMAVSAMVVVIGSAWAAERTPW